MWTEIIPFSNLPFGAAGAVRSPAVFLFYFSSSINLSTLQELAAAKNLEKIGVEELIAAGFINSRQLVKILGNGELTTKLDVTAHAFSKTAEAAITALGGTATKL